MFDYLASRFAALCFAGVCIKLIMYGLDTRFERALLIYLLMWTVLSDGRAIQGWMKVFQSK